MGYPKSFTPPQNTFGQQPTPIDYNSFYDYGAPSVTPTVSGIPTYGGSQVPQLQSQNYGLSPNAAPTGLGFGNMGDGLKVPGFSGGYSPGAVMDSAIGSKAGNTTGRSFWDNMTGGKNEDGSSYNGWGGLALGAGQGLMNAYLGMQMYGVAKDTLAANKDQFAKNYQAQVKTTNARQQDLIQGSMVGTQADKDARYNERKIG